MTSWLSAAVVGLALVGVSLPQTLATASINGQVVAASDNQPIRRVTITLNGESDGNRVTVSDDQGRFAFESLPAGRYTLGASRLGYVPAAHGATRDWRSPGVPIVLSAGQRFAGANFRLAKGGVITGRITDPLGQPIEDLWIGVGELRNLNGQMRITGVPANGNAASVTQIATTDDRGMYRIYGLPPGTFVVSAYRIKGNPLRTFEPTTAADLEWARRPSRATDPSMVASAPPPAPAVGYVPVFYPGTTDASAATTITLAPGEERGGIDFRIDAVPFATISGTVTGPSGEPMRGIMLYAVQLGAIPGGLGGILPPLGTSDASGQFTISGVPPGRFSVLAQPMAGTTVTPEGRPGPSHAVAFFAKTEVTVSGTDIRGLNVQLQPGVTVSGRVSVDGGPLSADVLRAKVRISAPPAPFGVSIVHPPIDLAADGSFRIDGVGPGSYVLSLSLPSPQTWMMTSAVLGDRDLMTAAFDVSAGQPVAGISVTVTDRVTEVSGRLLDGEGRPAPDYYVLVYPADRRLWSLGRDRLRAPVRPDTTGQYRVVGLPPGDYYLAALGDLQPNDYADASFLEMLISASLKLTLAAGEKKTQDVKFAGGG